MRNGAGNLESGGDVILAWGEEHRAGARTHRLVDRAPNRGGVIVEAIASGPKSWTFIQPANPVPAGLCVRNARC